LPCEGYYIPQYIWCESLTKAWNNNPKYVHLFEDYYVVDWTVLLTTGFFSNYYSFPYYYFNLEDKNGSLIKIMPEIKQNFQDSKSDFAQDMRNILVSDYKWNDYDFNALQNISNKQIDPNTINTSTSPFEYIQYVFVTDILRAAGYSDKDLAELFVPEKLPPLFASPDASGLIPIDATCKTWYKLIFDNKNPAIIDGFTIDIDFYKNYGTDYDKGQQLEYIQTTLLPYVKEALQSGKYNLPKSLL
jgi:hypothetical protein